jgi:hypothetical protein
MGHCEEVNDKQKGTGSPQCHPRVPLGILGSLLDLSAVSGAALMVLAKEPICITPVPGLASFLSMD